MRIELCKWNMKATTPKRQIWNDQEKKSINKSRKETKSSRAQSQKRITNISNTIPVKWKMLCIDVVATMNVRMISKTCFMCEHKQQYFSLYVLFHRRYSTLLAIEQPFQIASIFSSLSPVCLGFSCQFSVSH